MITECTLRLNDSAKLEAIMEDLECSEDAIVMRVVGGVVFKSRLSMKDIILGLGALGVDESVIENIQFEFKK